MNAKECGRCHKSFPIPEFCHDESTKDGRSRYCRACWTQIAKGRARTPTGRLVRIFHGQRRSSERRGHECPAYSREEFIAWATHSGEYQALYDKWAASGFNKELTPSCDRLDDAKGYAFDNVRWVTWAVNNDKGCASTKDRRSMPVQQLDRESRAVVAEYKSASEAAKAIGACRSNIVAALKGRLKSTSGFAWRYAPGDRSDANHFVRGEWRTPSFL